jgi:hypothetical protein
MGVAAATDDLVHPVEVALEWVAAAPRAALKTVTLDAVGADPAVLGAACLAALWEASSSTQLDQYPPSSTQLDQYPPSSTHP